MADDPARRHRERERERRESLGAIWRSELVQGREVLGPVPFIGRGEEEKSRGGEKTAVTQSKRH
jgi:hypothetical protein